MLFATSCNKGSAIYYWLCSKTLGATLWRLRRLRTIKAQCSPPLLHARRRVCCCRPFCVHATATCYLYPTLLMYVFQVLKSHRNACLCPGRSLCRHYTCTRRTNGPVGPSTRATYIQPVHTYSCGGLVAHT